MADIPEPQRNYQGNALKVVHTIPSLKTQAAGPSYSVVRLCQSMNALGIQNSLFALDDDKRSAEHNFVQLFPEGVGPRRLGRCPKMRDEIWRLANQNQLDLIHNHSLWMMPNVYPGEIARKKGIPLLIAPRGTLSSYAFKSGSWIKKIFWPLVQKPVLTEAHCFHATAFHEYEDIRAMGFKQPVAIIPNGIDVPAKKEEKSPDSRVVLYVGRLNPIKGLEVLLQSWQKVSLTHTDWSLKLVGPDNNGYLAKLQKIASDLDLKRCEFIGPVYGSNKYRMISAADLLVLPSFSENFGVVVAEALASSTPVITTFGTPWTDLPNKKAGWCVEANVTGITEGLNLAMDCDRSTLQKMGEKGKVWMDRDFSWSSVSKKTFETYSWIIDGGEKPEHVFID